jgi:transcriptional regulator with XRE-family HTH domain
MPVPSDFGRRLREVRDGAGISMRGLSLAADVSRDMVRQIEEGLIQQPSLKVAKSLAEAMGISLDWLASGIGDAPSAEALALAADRVRDVLGRTGT